MLVPVPPVFSRVPALTNCAVAAPEVTPKSPPVSKTPPFSLSIVALTQVLSPSVIWLVRFGRARAVDRHRAAGGKHTVRLGKAVGKARGRRDCQAAARYVEEILAEDQRIDDKAVGKAVRNRQRRRGADDDVINQTDRD